MPTTTLTVVGDEMEAEVLCGLLRANGIRCAYRKSNRAAAIAGASGWSIAGPTDVLVGEDDLAAAQALLRKS